MNLFVSLLKLDRDVSLAIHRAASSNAILRRLAAFAASDLVWIMVGFVFFLDVFGEGPAVPGERWLSVLALCVFVGLPWLVTLAIEYAVGRKRPFQAQPQAFKPIINMHLITPSFPSGHATVSTALALVFFASTGMPWLFLPMAAVVALGRIAVGVHYISDVLAGIAVALISRWPAMVFLVSVAAFMGLLNLD